jgi:hypothetical protein
MSPPALRVLSLGAGVQSGDKAGYSSGRAMG